MPIERNHTATIATIPSPTLYRCIQNIYRPLQRTIFSSVLMLQWRWPLRCWTIFCCMKWTIFWCLHHSLWQMTCLPQPLQRTFFLQCQCCSGDDRCGWFFPAWRSSRQFFAACISLCDWCHSFCPCRPLCRRCSIPFPFRKINNPWQRHCGWLWVRLVD
jgi:hypothetical protein